MASLVNWCDDDDGDDDDDDDDDMTIMIRSKVY